MNIDAGHSTRRRILEAAEPLFAEAGFAAVSLRQITAAAQVNVAAVNYHFYDKQRLHKELITLRLRQLNERRVHLLDAAEAAQREVDPTLEAIFDALARPLFQPDSALGPHAPRLISRILLEPKGSLDDVIKQEWQPTMARFGQACRRHARELSAEDFLWRFSQIIGALHHTVLILPAVDALTSGICSPHHPENALRNFVSVATSALEPDRP